MRGTMKKFSAVMLILALVFTMVLPAFAEEQAARTHITILHTNDMHGRIEAGSNDGMGLDKVATLVKEMKEKNPNTLVIDAGDAFHGLTIATLVKGESVAKVMDMIGYDVMVPGNHDFNYGYERLVELDGMTKFPILAANVKKEDGSNLLTSYVIKEVDGVKIGLFGLATPETAYKTHPNNVKGLTFADPVDSAKAMVAELKDKADVIVAVAHLGTGEEYIDSSEKVAKNVEGIDMIVDGHSHTVLEAGMTVGNTLIVQAGEYDKNLGIVDLYIENGKVVEKTAKLFTKAEAETTAADADITALVAKIKEDNDKITSVVVGKTDVALDGERANVRTGETNLGNLITDAMLHGTGADVAFTNGGGIRASVNAGEITKGDVVKVLPFGNFVVVKEIKGSALLEALEHGVDAYPEQAGHFAHVAGLAYKFDANKPVGQRITGVMVGGEKLDVAKAYKVATNDFMAAGGDNYVMFKGTTTLGEYGALDEVLASYLAEKGSVAPAVEGRIVAAEIAAADPEPTPEPAPTPAPTVVPEPAPAPVERPLPAAAAVKEYIVKAGDVLWKIAKAFGTTYEKLAELNGLQNPHMIYEGQKLLVPAQ